MITESILAWLHYLAILFLFGTLITQLFTLRLAPNADAVRLLGRVDVVYLMSAMAVLITGALRVGLGIKGWGWYLPNGLLHAKIGLFVLVGLISVKPALNFIQWRKTLEAGGSVLPAAIKQTKVLVHIELTLAALIPLIAALLARGYGSH